MASGDLEIKTETAFITFLNSSSTHGVSLGLTARHWAEDDTDNKSLPACTVRAERREELEPDTGVFQVFVEIAIEAQADATTEDTFEGYVENCESILQWNDLPAALSAVVADFKMWGISERGNGTKETTDRHWRVTYPLLIWAQASD